MGSTPVLVDYDFAAAEALIAELSAAAAKLSGLAQTRAGQRNAQLGAATSPNWQGRKRIEFEGRFSAQQQQLGGLADQMRRAIGAIQEATAQARSLAAAKITEGPR